jgi:hypothetical protein
MKGVQTDMLRKLLIPLMMLIICSSVAWSLTENEEKLKEDELAGVTLGFSFDQVKRILGEPQFISELQTDKADTKQIVWEYKNKGVKILFNDEKVNVIILEKPCNISTPRGLQIGDNWRKSLELYRYCSAYVQNMGYQIGIVFTLQEDLKLSIAIPSDSEEIMTISLWREEKQ